VTTHPLLDAGLELDCALRALMHGTRSGERRQRVREAARNLRREIVVATSVAAAESDAAVTIDQVRDVLQRARRSGVGWMAIADQVRELQGE